MNRRIVVARRPNGMLVEADFRMETVEPPRPAAGEVLLRTRYLSLGPYMRGRLDESSYAPAIPLGEVMVGSTIGEVVESRREGFAAGDLVLAASGWQELAVSDGRDLRKLDPAAAPPTLWFGVLGNSGFAAWVGVTEFARPMPGETLAVAAATGPVGATVVQMAKRAGARVIAIAGGAQKVAYACEVLGADAAIDHHAADFAQQLAAAAPSGIDAYFENVGGQVLFSVLAHLNPRARVAVCGLIAWYDLAGAPAGPDRTPELMGTILRKRLRVEGYILPDWEHRRAAFEDDVLGWLRDDRFAYKEDVVEGLANAPKALIGLLQGKNFGKPVIKL
jgi:NADPH-dependent curcumin reductase CurA